MRSGIATGRRASRSIDRGELAIVVATLSGLAGVLHLLAAATHRDHGTLAAMFLAAAFVQVVWAIVLVSHPPASFVIAGAVVNGTFAAFYVLTRLTGLTEINGLQEVQPVGFTDLVTTLLEIGAVAGALLMLSPRLLAAGLPVRLNSLGLPLIAVVALLLSGFAFNSGMDHEGDHAHAGGDHGEGEHAHADGDHDEDDHGHANGDHDDGDHEDGEHAHADGNHDEGDHGHADGDHEDGDHEDGHAEGDHGHGDADSHVAGAPHAHGDDPDHGGVGHGPGGGPGHGPGHDPSDPGHDPSDPGHHPSDPGFPPEWTPEQDAFAEQLIADTEEGLKRFTDASELEAMGFIWIGDGRQPGGYQHWVNVGWFSDTLNPDRPGSLVFLNTGDGLELQAAMYMLPLNRNLSNIPEEIAWLPGWHVHDNLCFGGGLQLAGLTDQNGRCPAGSTQIDTPPMLHVWIVDTECGRFAGVDENGLQCDHDHDPSDPANDPSDPGFPPEWTPEQDAFAEQLIADTEAGLTQFADASTLTAKGFFWIGDGGKPGGYQHWINLSWWSDTLDPNRPGSLVFLNTGDGLELQAAMYVLPGNRNLSNIPEEIAWLPGWHIHDNLCFSGLQLAGLTGPGGQCPPGSFRVVTPPMLHVWIVDTECGRFAGVDENGLQCDHEH